ncbi:ectonucleoside triphosphate diphosphohydrolase 5-like protein [Leptotrombidium deliense]|uniref:Ectonucleoside triphosphate diphosphohydrolase 5-like protein n=1 Tax=Leptotrombidium deliense TaxID=299467 RepID=A0A443SSA4_9ACAR|nr:ectonucleoside triphosphate diphosphohydrolase 5-like protein [Leptotrombidium deliense]
MKYNSLIQAFCFFVILVEVTNLRKHCDVFSKYINVIDAGSTGTRMHIFKYHFESNVIIVEKENFTEIQPGLSAYLNRIEVAATSLIPLLNYSNSIVPFCERSYAQIYVKATAGLRKLKNHTQAEYILNSVRSVLVNYSFPMKNTNSVSLLNSSSEGVNAWLTVNYLTNNLADCNETYAVLDLGGGSTQITFEVDSKTKCLFRTNTLKNKAYSSKAFELFTKSFHDKGLRSARQQILENTNDFKMFDVQNRVTLISHSCVPHNHTFNWNYEGITYVVNNSPVRDCYEAINSFVKRDESANKLSSALNDRTVVAIANYYKVALKSGMLQSSLNELLSLRVKDYLKQAKRICPGSFRNLTSIKAPFNKTMRNHYLSQNNFICVDLTYITILLKKVFGLKMEKEIYVVGKINEFEVSWALGYALQEIASNKYTVDLNSSHPIAIHAILAAINGHDLRKRCPKCERPFHYLYDVDEFSKHDPRLPLYNLRYMTIVDYILYNNICSYKQYVNFHESPDSFKNELLSIMSENSIKDDPIFE